VRNNALSMDQPQKGISMGRRHNQVTDSRQRNFPDAGEFGGGKGMQDAAPWYPQRAFIRPNSAIHPLAHVPSALPRRNQEANVGTTSNRQQGAHWSIAMRLS